MEIEPIQEAEDESRFDSKTICNLVILIAIGLIIGSAFLIGYEIYSAKSSCIDFGLEYKFEFDFPFRHLCNGETFFKYNDGWDFKNYTIKNYSDFTRP